MQALFDQLDRIVELLDAIQRAMEDQTSRRSPVITNRTGNVIYADFQMKRFKE